jgi:hypothetical protein
MKNRWSVFGIAMVLHLSITAVAAGAWIYSFNNHRDTERFPAFILVPSVLFTVIGSFPLGWIWFFYGLISGFGHPKEPTTEFFFLRCLGWIAFFAFNSFLAASIFEEVYERISKKRNAN